MRGKKRSLGIPLAGAAALLILLGALFLRWALGWERAADLVAGLIGAGLSWLVAGVLLCILWAARRPPAARPEEVDWPWLKARLDPYYGLLFSGGDREPGAFDRFLQRHFEVQPPPLLVWLLPVYLFLRMAEACAEEGDWSHFLDLSKDMADLICQRLSALDCFEEGRKLQYFLALEPEEGAALCPWFGARLDRLRGALTAYVRAHYDEFSGRGCP